MTVARVIPAPPDAVFAAFLDPDKLLAWLPPGGMTGTIQHFDARAGGGYRMTLAYPAGETRFKGKTTAKEDVVDVRFVVLDLPRRIVEAVRFAGGDPAFAGEMTIAIDFRAAAGGTEVAFTSSNLPPGLKAQDNDEGTRLSLENLARLFA